MIFRQYGPGELLAAYVAWFWFYEDLDVPHRREHVLRDGTFELIINLQDQPRRLLGRGGAGCDSAFQHAWMSGAHSQYIVIDALPAASMIDVHFKPGGAAAVLGRPADELRDEAVELDAIWGGSVGSLRDELLAAPNPDAKFAAFERALVGRLKTRRRYDAQSHCRVFWARDQFLAASPLHVRNVASSPGISPGRFSGSGSTLS